MATSNISERDATIACQVLAAWGCSFCPYSSKVSAETRSKVNALVSTYKDLNQRSMRALCGFIDNDRPSVDIDTTSVDDVDYEWAAMDFARQAVDVAVQACRLVYHDRPADMSCLKQFA